MGTWGTGIFQNDISDDVKKYFKDQLHRGKTAEQITKELIASYENEILDFDEKANFWLALADVQWDMGRLLPEVKEQATICLRDGSGIYPWEMSTKKEINKRKHVLDQLNQKLSLPQPPEKKVSQYRFYQCPWKVGDVFALPLESDQAKHLGLNQRYLLLEKAGERIYHPGHCIPIVYVKLSNEKMLPDSEESYHKLDYLKITTTQIDSNVLEALNSSGQTISVSDKLTQCIDESGNLTEYRLSIITTSSRAVPKKLVYLGNYPSCSHPAKEYIPDMSINLATSTWKNLEQIILSRYVISNSYMIRKKSDPNYS